MQLKYSENIDPPANTKRIPSWKVFKGGTKPARFRVTTEGAEPRVITVKSKVRQVLEGLMSAPLMSASYCRLGNQVMYLRRDHGVDILTELYPGDDDTGRQHYGVYFLKSKVERLDDEVAQ